MTVTIVRVGSGLQCSTNFPSDDRSECPLGVVKYPSAINHQILLDTDEFTNLTVSTGTSTLTHGGTVYSLSTMTKSEIFSGRYQFNITTYNTSPQIVQEDGATYSWSMQLKNSGGSLLWGSPVFSYTIANGVPTKAENPNPTDTEAEVDVDTSQLSWDDGGAADDFDVYFGTTGNMSLVSSAQGGTTWSIPSESLLYDTGYQWRIDSNNGNGSTTGDVWSFTTAALVPAVLDAPANGTTNHYLNSDWLANFTWTHELINGFGGEVHTVWFGPTGFMVPQTIRSRYSILTNLWRNGTTLEYNTEYQWKVVTVDRGDEVESETWTLTTIPFLPPFPGSGGEYGGQGGLNNMVTVKRLVVAAANAIFFEDE